jgi:hypothetical protein
MISEALVFLKDHLNAHLSAQSGQVPGDSDEAKVVFVDGERMDPITFKLGAVTILLINIEEERTLRSAEPYTRVAEDGAHHRVQPDIRMNLFVLFVARFKRYEQGLGYLSSIIQHFQRHRVLTPHNAPALAGKLGAVDKLIMELTTLRFAEQNEVWNALRTTYHPSVLYRVKMIAFRDAAATRLPAIEEGSVEARP